MSTLEDKAFPQDKLEKKVPTQADPFGDFDHVKPVSLEQAAEELQLAEARVAHLRTAVTLQSRALGELNSKYDAEKKTLAEKTHQLYLSAAHAFIPPKQVGETP
jgi:hypothetical protein